ILLWSTWWWSLWGINFLVFAGSGLWILLTFLRLRKEHNVQRVHWQDWEHQIKALQLPDSREEWLRILPRWGLHDLMGVVLDAPMPSLEQTARTWFVQLSRHPNMISSGAVIEAVRDVHPLDRERACALDQGPPPTFFVAGAFCLALGGLVLAMWGGKASGNVVGIGAFFLSSVLWGWGLWLGSWWIQRQHRSNLQQRVFVQQQLQHWLGEQLWPALLQFRASIRDIQPTQEGGPVVSTWLSEDTVQALQKTLIQQQELLEGLAQQLRSWQETDVSEQQTASRQLLTENISLLRTWNEHLESVQQHFGQAVHKLSEGLEPIAHAERLLSERMSALNRHHVSLSDLLERLERQGKTHPERFAELLRRSLQPAHQLL
ncbi:MAG: hypothetical protein AAGJ35_14305, partial [Myxococcota bacterium]